MVETRVLLLTDIVDSTRLNQSLGDATMADLWASHDQAARGLLRAHHGLEIGRADGFLVLFDSVDAAVAFALAYHRRLAAFTPALQARVGIHAGAVSLRENSPADRAQGATPFEIDGIALPMAARLMAAANGGQTLLSSAAAGQLTRSVGQQRSHGHWRFKGVDEPTEVVEVGDDGAAFAPPPDSAKAYRVVKADGQWRQARELPHHLPAERDTFVGREAALRRLSETLDGGARLVTLLGMGGIGKTRLALRYARGWLGDYPGGAWFCDLSPATTADGVLHSVAQGLDVPLGKADPVWQIGEAISGRGRCLVVLDNFEQVASHAEATLGAWMQRAPQAEFIVTSREVLGIAGENVFTVDALVGHEAVTLFRQRAMAAGLGPDEAASGAVQQLVDLLDRLPLAIELAAARAPVLPVGELLRGMGERFKLLVRRGGPQDRQATLRAAIDWSWALLSPLERGALAQLSVFEGGCSLAAAQAVISMAGAEGATLAIDAMQGLFEKSMLRRGRSDRFELLGMVQDYAAEQLEAMRGAADARTRHWRYFAGLDEADVSNRRCDDIENIVVACRRAAAAGDAAAAVRTLMIAAAVVQLIGPIGVVSDLVSRVRAGEPLNDAQRAAVARVAGNVHYALGQRAEAVAEYREGLRAARLVGHDAVIARLSCALADLQLRSGQKAAAAEHLARAEGIWRQSGDPQLTFIVLNALGSFELGQGRLDQARRHFEDALPITRALKHRRREGGLLGNLGNVHYALGERERAAAYYEQALAIGEDAGDRRWAANARCNLGLVRSERGEYDLAQVDLKAAIATAREIGYSQLEATALCNLGLMLDAAKRPGEATEHLRAAAAIAERLQDWGLALQCWRPLAAIARDMKDWPAAHAALGQALKDASEMGDVLATQALRAEIAQLVEISSRY